MFRMVVLIVLSLLILSFAEQPTPFGLELGKTTEQEFLKVVKQKGWHIEKSGYKVIKLDVVNPDVTGYVISNIAIERFKVAKFLFYKGTLFQIVYYLEEDEQGSTFQIYYDQLKVKYGEPASYKELQGEAIWKFSDVMLSLYSTSKGRESFVLLCFEATKSFENCFRLAQKIPLKVHITYTHIVLNKKAESSDEYYYRKYIEEKSRETEGL